MFKKTQTTTIKHPEPQQYSDDENLQLLAQKDFLNMITLQEKYNYYKNLISIQTLNNLSEVKSQKMLMKVMLELINYYAICIAETQANIDNIVKYFQHKMKDLNLQYKQIFDKNKTAKLQEKPSQKRKNSLGSYDSTGILKLPEPEEPDEDQQQVKIEVKTPNIKDIKANFSKSIMIAMHNQNIEAHLAETNKKAEFVKKSIANSIKLQEDDLNRRRIESKKKREESLNKKNNELKTSFSATPQSNKSTKVCASFTSMSTQLDLDEPQKLFQNFSLQKLDELDIKLSPHNPKNYK